MFSTGDTVLITLSGEGYDPQLTSSPTATALTSTHKDTPQVRKPVVLQYCINIDGEINLPIVIMREPITGA